jgi:hypothetical protein
VIFQMSVRFERPLAALERPARWSSSRRQSQPLRLGRVLMLDALGAMRRVDVVQRAANACCACHRFPL